MDITTLVLWVILGLVVWVLVMKIVFASEKKMYRDNVLKGSRNSILGEVYEKVLPALPNFPYAPKDMVFIGKGCDYIIFDGLSEWHLREIVFLELKSGRATLTTNERAIQDAVGRNRVRFSEYRIDSTRSKE